MALPLALFAAGTALSAFGQYQANIAQAEADEQNALWLDQQAEFAEESTAREEDVFLRKTELAVGEQVAALGASGFEISGSALDLINDSFNSAQKEIDAIRLQGRMKIEEASLKAQAARANADRLTDPTTNLLQVGGTALSGAARFTG